MKRIKLIISSAIICLAISTTACSDDNKKERQIYPDIEDVAKEHAQQFSNTSLSKMQIQHKLFEVRAHEQDLRDANMNKEADYYIEMFTKHLNTFNPSLAKEIEKK